MCEASPKPEITVDRNVVASPPPTHVSSSQVNVRFVGERGSWISGPVAVSEPDQCRPRSFGREAVPDSEHVGADDCTTLRWGHVPAEAADLATRVGHADPRVTRPISGGATIRASRR